MALTHTDTQEDANTEDRERKQQQQQQFRTNVKCVDMKIWKNVPHINIKYSNCWPFS